MRFENHAGTIHLNLLNLADLVLIGPFRDHHAVAGGQAYILRPASPCTPVLLLCLGQVEVLTEAGRGQRAVLEVVRVRSDNVSSGCERAQFQVFVPRHDGPAHLLADFLADRLDTSQAVPFRLGRLGALHPLHPPGDLALGHSRPPHEGFHCGSRRLGAVPMETW